MGRNKFEDQIKRKLEEREITPSPGSWEKLSGQLNTDQKKPVHLFWWIGIAATLVGGFFIAGMFYTQPGNVIPGIVVSPVEDILIENQTQPVIDNKLATDEVVPEKTYQTTNPAVQLEKIKPVKVEDLNSNQLAGSDVQESRDINNKESFQPGNKEDGKRAELIAQTETPELNGIKESALAAEIENVLVRLAEIETGKGTISGSEVDSLLYEAASQISMKRNIERSNGKIDATALLWDVEMEMEHSFREKIFEVLKDGYLKAKWAVANRNQ